MKIFQIVARNASKFFHNENIISRLNINEKLKPSFYFGVGKRWIIVL